MASVAQSDSSKALEDVAVLRETVENFKEKISALEKSQEDLLKRVSALEGKSQSFVVCREDVQSRHLESERRIAHHVTCTAYDVTGLEPK